MRYADGIDASKLPAPIIETAYDPYQFQRAENEARLSEPRPELPPMQTYENMPSIKGARY